MSISNLSRRNMLGLALLPSLSSMLLAACAARPEQRPDARDTAQQSFLGKAYRNDLPLRLESHRSSLNGPHGTIYTEMTAPRDGGNYPLVIYLPGLAESTSDGSTWRSALAEAGYAVLSIQAQGDGSALLASDLARAGDFNQIGRQAFRAEALQQRMDNLAFVLAQLPQLAKADLLYSRGDASRLLLAGFDLGAQTALAMASTATMPPAGLRGLILISPYHDRQRSDSELYAKLQLPVLNITSAIDVDDYGVIPDASARIVPYQAMPRGDKYLLVMRAMSHRNLGGKDNLDEMMSKKEAGPGSKGRRGGSGAPPDGGGMGGGPGGGMGGGMSGSPGGGMGGEASGGKGGFGAPGGSDQAGPDDNANTQQGFTVLRSVMLAFADSAAKNDNAAQDWLALDAPRWLRPLGTLSSK
jgi:alpha-beta hydrolase superfamily lysophospholipase